MCSLSWNTQLLAQYVAHRTQYLVNEINYKSSRLGEKQGEELRNECYFHSKYQNPNNLSVILNMIFFVVYN